MRRDLARRSLAGLDYLSTPGTDVTVTMVPRALGVRPRRITADPPATAGIVQESSTRVRGERR